MTPQEMFMRIVIQAAPQFAAKDPGNLVGAQQNAESLARGCVQRCSELGLFNPQPITVQQEQPTLAPQLAARAPTPAPAPVSFPQDPPAVAQPQVPQQPQVGQPLPTQQAAAVQPAQPQQVAQPLLAQPVPQQQHAHGQVTMLNPPQQPVAQGVPFPQATPGAQAQGVGGIPQAQVAVGAGVQAAPAEPYMVAGTQIVPPAGSTFQAPAQAGVMNTVTQAPTAQGHSALGAGGVVQQPIQRPIGQETVVAPGNEKVIQQPVGGNLPQVVQEQIVR